MHKSNKLKALIKNKNSLYIIGSVYLIYHILTLGISPLPWFDEVCFVNITDNFYNYNRLYFDIYPWRFPQNMEALSYGPVYFYLTKYFWLVFGKGIIQFRIVNLLFAALSLVMLIKILKIFTKNRLFVILFSFLVATDPVFIQNSHSGRMDLVAFFFIVVSLYFLLKRNQASVLDLIISSVFAGLALLTTPRVFFLIIALGLVLLLNIYKLANNKNRVLLHILSWGLPISLMYLTWIFVGFGGIKEFFSYYLSNPIITSHFGGNWNVTSFQYPLLLIISTSLIISFFYFTKAYFNLIIFTVVSLILFYLLIYDYGNYNAMVLPFGYLIIILTADNASSIWIKKSLSYSIALLLIINIGIFSVKNMVVLSSAPQRSNTEVSKIISRTVNPKSKVVGDDRYYYATILNKNPYQSIEEGNISRDNINEKIDYQKEFYDFDYLILSNESNKKNPAILEAYKKNYPLKELAKIELNSNNKNILTTFISKITKLVLGHSTHGSMEGVIYQVLKE